MEVRNIVAPQMRVVMMASPIPPPFGIALAGILRATD
jgi:hypothetical protein